MKMPKRTERGYLGAGIHSTLELNEFIKKKVNANLVNQICKTYFDGKSYAKLKKSQKYDLLAEVAKQEASTEIEEFMKERYPVKVEWPETWPEIGTIANLIIRDPNLEHGPVNAMDGLLKLLVSDKFLKISQANLVTFSTLIKESKRLIPVTVHYSGKGSEQYYFQGVIRRHPQEFYVKKLEGRDNRERTLRLPIFKEEQNESPPKVIEFDTETVAFMKHYTLNE